MLYRYHMRVLDNFYARPNVPAQVKALRDKAYAKVHLNYAIGLLRAGFGERASSALQTAFSLDPELLNVVETYFSVAASPRPLQADRDLTVDLPSAERCVGVLLRAIEAARLSSPNIAFHAFYALSQMAYWQRDDARARQWMRHALAAKPTNLMQPQTARWVIRSILGANVVRRLKR
jgi:hypothetical protein